MYNPHNCPICWGNKKIEIGRNLDNKSEEFIECPVCLGKGMLNIKVHTYSPEYEKLMKRLYGDNYGKN